LRHLAVTGGKDILILLTVAVIDQVSARLRRRLIG
jgi:ABC-type phosphate/phosphonate transport system permease subunit